MPAKPPEPDLVLVSTGDDGRLIPTTADGAEAWQRAIAPRPCTDAVPAATNIAAARSWFDAVAQTPPQPGVI